MSRTPASRSADPARPRRIGAFRRAAACDAGAAALEFAFVVGLIVMLVIGSVQVGRALMARNEMNHALAQAIRLVHIEPSTEAPEIEQTLQALLSKYQDLALDVEITEVVGTSFLRIVVQFPFRVAVPLLSDHDVTLRVETLAPMVSPTQG